MMQLITVNNKVRPYLKLIYLWAKGKYSKVNSLKIIKGGHKLF